MTLGIAACLALAIVASPNAGLAVLVSLAVYAAGLMAMLGCSAVYNIAGHDPRRAFCRRLDHAAIFMMIAGTYTPFAAIAIGGTWGTGLLVFVWTVALAGMVLKLLHPGWLESPSIAAYLLLGWTVLVAIAPDACDGSRADSHLQSTRKLDSLRLSAVRCDGWCELRTRNHGLSLAKYRGRAPRNSIRQGRTQKDLTDLSIFLVLTSLIHWSVWLLLIYTQLHC